MESVWLDASIKNKHIVWADNTSTDYENWIAGRPVNDSNCVEMVPDQLNTGKWLDQPCGKKNIVACKRMVTSLNDHEQRLLPSQADPNTLWPAYEWSDVTATYAGQFFRAEGNGSLDFNTGVQAENSPRLSEVKNFGVGGEEWDLKLTPGVWSKLLYTGSGGGGDGPVSIAKIVISEGVCGDDWDLFQDEYSDVCYRYIPDNLGDYATIVNYCKLLNSSLPTINSKAEQDYLNKLIVKYKMVENVWLDAGIKNKHIVWKDRTTAMYENWESGHPINDDNCVEMVTDEDKVGKWLDRPCTKKNAYLCKRVVMWSGDRIERLFSDLKRVLDRDESKIAQLEQNQVPVGFTYVQLPGKPEPKTLWPAYQWSDVTAEYAGQFFRAEGNAPGVWSKNVLSGGPVHGKCREPCGCNGWVAYGDEKCYRVFNTTYPMTYAQSGEFCGALKPGPYYPTLPIVESADEHRFLVDYLSDTFANWTDVWIGARRWTSPADNSTLFQWWDGSTLNYSNWLSGEPCLIDRADCVAMKSRFNMIGANAHPNTLWPIYTWSDVTATYAGQFFRAEGGDSLGFGNGVQGDNSPRVTSIQYGRKICQHSCGCDGWVPYGDEKCYRVFNTTRPMTYALSKEFCAALNAEPYAPTLPIVESADEHRFLVDYLSDTFANGTDVWIGAQRRTLPADNVTDFKWWDGSSVEYSNWLPGRPSVVDRSDCVVMKSRYTLTGIISHGQWVNTVCNAHNVVLCQKIRYWQHKEMQNIVIAARRHTTQMYNNLDTVRNIHHYESKITQMADEHLPVGYIYVQYPHQSDPINLWPAYTWSDVTATYAGQFFRAEGGGSLTFNQGVQSEQAPKISKISWKSRREGEGNWNIDLPANGWSDLIFGGLDGGFWGEKFGSRRFYVTGGEVRPRNQAVRIFKRTMYAWANHQYCIAIRRMGAIKQWPYLAHENCREPCGCNGWVPYGDEKCYRVYNTTRPMTYAASGEFCGALKRDPYSPTLPIVESADEHRFLVDYLADIFANGTDVWIGARRRTSPTGNVTDFKWWDGSSVEYSNWLPGGPSPVGLAGCVAMIS
ncbi:unnamed protein product [Medioppia subpectinata]|uniref:C-type lectin domain-containing protein n=1 Tax=Medioppia subpectinata TaxID=1979941 RepID=A0A7R9PUT9_9ACAR|nr:unnamed protein product [Medioppia subpectinata]CAG2102106.1 unnamed protein product [Medioppia subpectinata]